MEIALSAPPGSPQDPSWPDEAALAAFRAWLQGVPSRAAVDRYLKLAFKAQSACRVTLDSLARLHQPREQTVKHVHINDGGQAVVVDHLHQTTGGPRNGKSDEQSHATDDPGASAALPSPNPLGTPMPSARRPREA